MNIYQKLIEVRKEVPYLQKADVGAQYNYTGSSRVLAACRKKMDELELLLMPAVTSTNVRESTVEYIDKNGIPKRTTTYFTELEMTMTWVNAENPEEKITSPWYAQGVDIAGEKGVGKALTYGEKYFLLKFFNIATDKDDPDAFQQKMDPDADNPPTTSQKPQQAMKQQGAGQQPVTKTQAVNALIGGPLLSESQASYAEKLKKQKRVSDEDFRRMVAELAEGNTDLYQMSKKAAGELINLLQNIQMAGA